MKKNQQARWFHEKGDKNVKLQLLYTWDGLKRVEVDEAHPGDIIAIAGIEDVTVGDTLAVGDAGMVSSAVFHDLDYVALGHLHRAQIVGGDERIRYSGSPLAYSFGETAQKEVVLIELDDDVASRWGPRVVDFLQTVVDATSSVAEPVG